MTLGKCNNVDTTVVLDIEYRVVMLRCDIFLKTQYGLAHFKYLWHFDDTFSTVFNMFGVPYPVLALEHLWSPGYGL